MIPELLMKKKKKKLTMQEAILLEEMGLEESYAYTQDPMFVAQFHFEHLKFCFKRDPRISGHEGKNWKIHRLREACTNLNGFNVNSSDAIEIDIDAGNAEVLTKYANCASKMFGVKAELDYENGKAFFRYNEEEIQNARRHKNSRE